MEAFYGPEQAGIHHERFGRLAGRAADLLLRELATAGLASGTVVDLGCGSGILARRLTDAGYDVLGVDVSAPMLEIARSEAPLARFVQAPLLDVDLPRAVAITATGEALNYLVDERTGDPAFDRLARRVAEALVPRGVFLFDVSVHGRSGPDGVRVQFHDAPDWSIGVRETEDATTVTREIATFRRGADGRYARVDERHVLYLYDPGRLVATLQAAGFEARLLGDYTGDKSMAGWIVVSARRQERWSSATSS